MATHGLARYAQYVDDFVTWMEEIPPIIETKVTPDVNQFSQSRIEIKPLVSD